MPNPTLPELKCEGVDDATLGDLRAILYALTLIRRETGFGTLEIEIREGGIIEMRAEHKIKPFLKPRPPA